MKMLISEIFMIVVAVALIVSGVLFVKSSLAGSVEEIGEYLEDRKSIRRLTAQVRRLSADNRRNLAIEVLLWDTQKRLDWLQTKSMLSEPEKQEQIERCRQMLSEERAQATVLVGNMQDKEIVRLISTETKNRDIGWRRNLLSRLRG